MLQGRVLITGGAGFLGRGIMRRARAEGWPCDFTVYSRDEYTQQRAKAKYDARYIAGDILDTNRLRLVMHGVDYVIHAAAIKYIPGCEAQPSEAIKNNVLGTMSVMDAAAAAGVKRVVVISTDKAPAPLNTYGMTKALCERLVFETVDLPQPSGTTYTACRYGNVIGSTGSIWPVFKAQAEKGPLQVTDPEMTRFFIDINEAVDLIASAFEAPPGTVVIPEPSAIAIGPLVEYVSDLWGVAFNVIGRRPGEKLHEDMLAPFETERVGTFGEYWLLHGPTKESPIDYTNDLKRMSSDLAVQIDPAKWVEVALDSEGV